ncbi:response regulator transcription factor [Alloyangia pacifica]|uniref:Response regulator receiver domain-containing protein n=1 Tax=Alloyangia pacifica TaxID=311180 RepID=A0A1I6V9V3_9RHOB|nr:response regulator [Alloyangia pacifica]SDH88142.1 Response regulator receiver domain-containing protein [Alloyangia pacifica]SFT10402.1 Response regulator receiver domain-containing protein [Alloyangia pacifica]
MKVLIVQTDQTLAGTWSSHLERTGADVSIVSDQDSATRLMHIEDVDVIVLDLMLASGSALAVADFASYRQPDCRVIFVTDAPVFSDGSIFQHCANACAYLPTDTSPSDLAAMVEHYGVHCAV